ncbi:pilin [Marinicella sp. W31]|uniref:pilin n=1 Tax=Marinicella sp. W31 TaxID=3023713 RepID=UPI0037573B85
MNSFVGKFLLVVGVAIGLIYGYKLYEQNQNNQQQLKAEISDLKNMLSTQEAERADQQRAVVEEVVSQKQEVLNAVEAQQAEVQKQLAESVDQQRAVYEEVVAQKQEMLNAVEAQQAEVEKQLAESKKQTEILEQQVEQMTDVVDQMEDERQQEEERNAELEEFAQDSLYAAYISTGMNAAASLKIRIAEYYMMNDVFPHSNEVLGLPSPKKYSSDIIRSITVSRGGKITVVYTEKSGQDKAAINLKPTYKNEQIEWSCTTRDFANIQNFMPICQYKG